MTQTQGVNRIDIAEFRGNGFLQEANRQFFHPLGLALEVHIDDVTGAESLGGIWDYRDDPEGILFSDPPDGDKSAHVEALRAEKAIVRINRFGWSVQPVGEAAPDA